MDEQFSVPLTGKEREIIDRLQAEDQRQRDAGLSVEERTRNISETTGAYLWQMVVSHRPKSILEIGSSTGLSTLWLASAAHRVGATVLGTEIVTKRAEANNAQLQEAGLGETARVANADHRSLEEVRTQRWDFVFLDAEKDDYLGHLQAIEPHLAPGAVILTDNVISHDCHELQEYLRSSQHYSTCTVTLDRGIEYSIYLAPDPANATS